MTDWIANKLFPMRIRRDRSFLATETSAPAPGTISIEDLRVAMRAAARLAKEPKPPNVLIFNNDKLAAPYRDECRLHDIDVRVSNLAPKDKIVVGRQDGRGFEVRGWIECTPAVYTTNAKAPAPRN